MNVRFGKTIIAALALSVVLVGCGGNKATSNLKGSLDIDGSSTLYPLTAAVAEEFGTDNKNVKITVSESGTGSGMKRFCVGEIKVADASRPISDEEKAACEAKGIKFTELKVALDGITVVVNKNNTWAKELTVAQLKSIFEMNSKVTKWSDIPGTTGFPDEKINIYTPGSASGTFEFFTDHINGTKKVQRVTQVTQSEDDNVLVTGVAGDKYAIGYFGFGYYDENQKKVNDVKILDAAKADKAVEPTVKTIADGSYTLARPLYLYVDSDALKNDDVVSAFVKYYMDNTEGLASDVLMVPLPEDQLADEQAKVE
jgi:phosphate transport system substrate-binding protein